MSAKRWLPRITPKRLGFTGLGVAIASAVWFYYVAAYATLLVPICGKAHEPPICAELAASALRTFVVFVGSVLVAAGALAWGVVRRVRAARRREAERALASRPFVDYRGMSSTMNRSSPCAGR